MEDLIILFDTCMTHHVVSTLHSRRKMQQGICETEACHLHMKKHEDPFVGHVLEFDCMKPLKRMRIENNTLKQLRHDCVSMSDQQII